MFSSKLESIFIELFSFSSDSSWKGLNNVEQMKGNASTFYLKWLNMYVNEKSGQLWRFRVLIVHANTSKTLADAGHWKGGLADETFLIKGVSVVDDKAKQTQFRVREIEDKLFIWPWGTEAVLV